MSPSINILDITHLLYAPVLKHLYIYVFLFTIIFLKSNGYVGDVA